LFAVDTLSVVAVANGSRPELATSAVTNGAGGTMKSPLDVAVPYGVVMLIWPDPVLDGTVPVSDVEVPLDTSA
jgi:hypothetical protein